MTSYHSTHRGSCLRLAHDMLRRDPTLNIETKMYDQLLNLAITTLPYRFTLSETILQLHKKTMKKSLELIKRLQHQGDEYTRKIETEKRLIANLQSNLSILHAKV